MHQIDIPWIAKLYYIHSYASAKALTEVVGMGQAVLARSYAKAFIDIARTMNLNLDSFKEFVSELKRMKLLEDCRLRQTVRDEVEVVVEKCTLASMVHEPLGLEGYTGDLCPLALMTMVVLAKERGWTPDKDLFAYIRFTGRLSYFTKDGTITSFQIR